MIRTVTMIVVAIGALVLVGGLVVFTVGEDLFGSDRGTIDSYNREVLDTCETPVGSTLLRTYTLDEVDGSGNFFRSLSYVYASPLSADEVVDFYGLGSPGRVSQVTAQRSCRFGNRPRAVSQSTLDGFWSGEGAEIVDLADPPANSRSFFMLRLAQEEREGVFGLGATNLLGPTDRSGRPDHAELGQLTMGTSAASYSK